MSGAEGFLAAIGTAVVMSLIALVWLSKTSRKVKHSSTF